MQDGYKRRLLCGDCEERFSAFETATARQVFWEDWGQAPIPNPLDKGADGAEEDAVPWATPLSWAVKMGHSEIEVMLRNWRNSRDAS